MKKSILFLPFVFIIIFVVIVSSVFLPQIKLEITIQPQFQSIVKAEKADNSIKKQAHCVILSDDNIRKITKNINTYYDHGYRLKNFSATSHQRLATSIADLIYFAPVCKE